MLPLSLAITAATFAATALASPLNRPILNPRAGAPTPSPIPSNCTVSDPLDHCDPAQRYKPTASANSTLLYSYFLQPDSPAVTSSNASALFQQCLDTCYGYGDAGDCKAAYLAYGYPMPPAFGLAGGETVVACLMWGRVVVAGADFEGVPAGVAGYGNSTAGNILCPASQARRVRRTGSFSGHARGAGATPGR